MVRFEEQLMEIRRVQQEMDSTPRKSQRYRDLARRYKRLNIERAMALKYYQEATERRAHEEKEHPGEPLRDKRKTDPGSV